MIKLLEQVNVIGACLIPKHPLTWINQTSADFNVMQIQPSFDYPYEIDILRMSMQVKFFERCLYLLHFVPDIDKTCIVFDS